MESQGNDRRNGRTISLNTIALKVSDSNIFIPFPLSVLFTKFKHVRSQYLPDCCSVTLNS